MLERHTTREGAKLLIAQMSDQHLRNYVNLCFTGIRRAKEICQTGKDASEYERALYDLPKIDDYEAGEAVREAIRSIYPYLAEAFLRDMRDVQADLIDVMGRSTLLTAMPQLESPVESDF